MYLANGDIPAKRPNLPAEIHGQWPHDTDLVLGDNADEFSWRQCDCCGSKLGGSRTAFAVLGLPPSTRTGLNLLKKRNKRP